MSDFLHTLATAGFLQTALVGGLLAAVACGVIGPFVVVRRIGYIAGGIAHGVLGGMGVAYFLGVHPIAGAVAAALLAALIIGWVSLRSPRQQDTIISALWATGMAVGIVFMARTPGYNANLMSFLFGNILMISRDGLWVIAALDAVILLTVAGLYKQLVALAFDEEFALLRGVPVRAYYLLLLAMVALTVVALIQVVGLILVIALLTMPAAIAMQFFNSLHRIMIAAVLLGAAFTTGGLGIAYEANLPAGAAIVLFTAVAYLGFTLVAHWLAGRRAARARQAG